MAKAINFDKVWAEAVRAAKDASRDANPIPMLVGATKGLSNEIDFDQKIYQVDDGVCGFSWIHTAGNTSFGRWAKKAGLTRTSYFGGYDISVTKFGLFSQSYQRGQAAAAAAVAVLRAAGVEAYADGRLD